MNTLLKKFALAAGAAATLAFATQASALPQFTVNPSSLPGVTTAPFVADSANAASSELLTFTNGGFTATGSGYASLSSWILNSTNVKKTSLNDSYGVYLTYDLSVSNPTQMTSANGVTTTTYQLNSLNFQLWADVGSDDTYTNAKISADGSTVISGAGVTNTAGDILLGNGKLLGGTAGFDSNNGSFLNSTEAFSLTTPAGTSFFTEPNPFYTIAFDGFINTFQGIIFTNDKAFAAVNATGIVDFNKVPEPDTLALFGIAAVGLGLAAKRRKA